MILSPAGWLQNSLRTCALAAGLALASGPVGASDNHMGTPEERAACQPEVFRLCSEFIPDVPRITACLKREVRNLTPACRAVMTGRPLPRANSRPDSAVR